MMLTAPRQRVRTAVDATNAEDTSKRKSLLLPKRTRGKQRKAHKVWEIFGVTLMLVLLVVVFAPIATHQRGSTTTGFVNNTVRFITSQKHNMTSSRPILTAFLEPFDTLQQNIQPLPIRNTSASRLTRIEYPEVKQCSMLSETFPIDNFPTGDPFLPWIHDVFPTSDGKYIQFVAQNKRRCDTGKDHEKTMEHWEPQISLFQPVPIKITTDSKNGVKTGFRLATYEEADVKETRFLCRFHSGNLEETTLSEYPFNYEYISWRKHREGTMFVKQGKDAASFWLSQLYFSCPVPPVFQDLIQTGSHVQNDVSELFVDVVPIRTPPRDKKFLFSKDHVGAEPLASQTIKVFDATTEWGSYHILPEIIDSGRWANIPVCLPPIAKKRNRLVACTWAAMSYSRRGESVQLKDTAGRFREWIEFHSMVGFDQLFVYDNTVLGDSPSEIERIASEYPDTVTYHRWPCQICNNNRPAHANPGERSSQYAAEASCRERYGSNTDWMATIDIDEYLVPMKGDTWDEILDDMDQKGMKILKLRSARAKPRVRLMEELQDQSSCVDTNERRKKEPDSCLVPRKDQTFLRVYNCEYIKPPRPSRFVRAMKQIYRPDYVYSHFVHYSTVTKDIARLRKDYEPYERYIRSVQSDAWQAKSPEVFLDELNEGNLVHTRSVLPSETTRRTDECYNSSKFGCMMGYECPDSTEFVDAIHQKNIFHDDEGNYCNCWINHRIEDFFVPKLEAALERDEER